MKLSWRDIVTALFMVSIGAVVFAMYQEYSWWLIGNSWQFAVGVISVLGLTALAVGTYGVHDDGTRRSVFDVVEAWMVALACVVAIAGMIVSSQILFYSLAALTVIIWLTALIRHTTRTLHPAGTYKHFST